MDEDTVRTQLRESIAFILFHSRVGTPTPTKWMSEWDSSCWGAAGLILHRLVQRAWLLEWPVDDHLLMTLVMPNAAPYGCPRCFRKG